MDQVMKWDKMGVVKANVGEACLKAGLRNDEGHCTFKERLGKKPQ